MRQVGRASARAAHLPYDSARAVRGTDEHSAATHFARAAQYTSCVAGGGHREMPSRLRPMAVPRPQRTALKAK